MHLFSDELAQSGHALTNACLNVYSKSGYVEIQGKETRVGTQQELHSQVRKNAFFFSLHEILKSLLLKLQRCKMEKDLLEKKADSLEEKNKKLSRELDEVRRGLAETQGENKVLKEDKEQLNKTVST